MAGVVKDWRGFTSLRASCILYGFVGKRQGRHTGETGQTHLISAFADLLFDEIIRQNQPFWRWRRHLALFAAHVLEYIPRKKRHFSCQRAKILFFRILPAQAIRLRFAPAEQRWLRLFLFVPRSTGE